MRVLLRIDDCYQLYETVDIMSGDNDNPTLVIHLNNSVPIIVEGIYDPLTCLRTLMSNGFIDLSNKHSYFYHNPTQYCEKIPDEECGIREIEHEDIEIELLFEKE